MANGEKSPGQSTPEPAPSPPGSLRRAVMDVGTNSVKLLVADVAGSRVSPVWEESKQTRLGKGFYQDHRLQSEAIQLTAQAVADFAAKARQMSATSLRVIGTSAARDAINSKELINAVGQRSGLELEVIPGEQEAEWAFHGVRTDPALAALPLLILDLGGGSTEFIVGENSTPIFCHSFKLGTVRLIEQLTLGDPPGLEALGQCKSRVQEFLRQEVAPLLTPGLHACSARPHFVGTGGTATILARMEAKMEGFEREKIEALHLSLERIQLLAKLLWQTPLAERKKIIGLPPNRADVILTGVAIYEAIMETFRFGELQISTRGLRYSALVL